MRKKKPAVPVRSMKAIKTRTPYSHTAEAIEKKMQEIKSENTRKGATSNQLTLFRYLA